MRIVFFGTPDFAATIIQGLIDAGHPPVLCVSQPDKAQGRKQIIVPTPVHEIAEANNIPLLQARKIKTQEFFETIASYEPDFVVTAAYGRILPSRILNLAKFDAVNVHGSLLPKFRGASPVQATLLACEKTTGVTIVRMTEELDAGPMYKRVEYVIPDGMRSDELMLELAKLGAQALPKVLEEIYNAELIPVEQDHSKASHVGLIDKSMGQINWDKSALEIEGQVRGLYPWPGAYTFEGNRRTKIHRAKAYEVFELPELLENYENLDNGTVVSLAEKSIWVKSGKGILRLLEIQRDNSKAMPTSANYHNYQIAESKFNNEKADS